MRLRPSSRGLALFSALLLVAAACGGEDESAEPAPTQEDSPDASPQNEPPLEEPVGVPLSAEDIQELADQFSDNPLTGGQTAPRLYRWVNDDVAIFVQFDDRDVTQATELRYIGASVKGTFCAETQPDPEKGSFTHFHALDGEEYAESHGGPAGTEGYWLSWMAVGGFTANDGREVAPGVDYEFSPTPPPPSCDDAQAEVAFDGPDAGALTPEEIVELAALVPDQPLTGGQTVPRLYKWVNEDVAIFAQFDNPDPAEATAMPYIGISVKGEFCESTQPSEDFPHFHQTDGEEYAESHGESPGDTGYWLAWMATDSFESRDGRDVVPGIDREFSPTPPPDC